MSAWRLWYVLRTLPNDHVEYSTALYRVTDMSEARGHMKAVDTHVILLLLVRNGGANANQITITGRGGRTTVRLIVVFLHDGGHVGHKVTFVRFNVQVERRAQAGLGTQAALIPRVLGVGQLGLLFVPVHIFDQFWVLLVHLVYDVIRDEEVTVETPVEFKVIVLVRVTGSVHV